MSNIFIGTSIPSYPVLFHMSHVSRFNNIPSTVLYVFQRQYSVAVLRIVQFRFIFVHYSIVYLFVAIFDVFRACFASSFRSYYSAYFRIFGAMKSEPWLLSYKYCLQFSSARQNIFCWAIVGRVITVILCTYKTIIALFQYHSFTCFVFILYVVAMCVVGAYYLRRSVYIVIHHAVRTADGRSSVK